MSEIEIPDELVELHEQWELTRLGHHPESGTYAIYAWDGLTVLAHGFASTADASEARRACAVAALRRQVLESVVPVIAKAFHEISDHPLSWAALPDDERTEVFEFLAKRALGLTSEGEGS